MQPRIIVIGAEDFQWIAIRLALMRAGDPANKFECLRAFADCARKYDLADLDSRTDENLFGLYADEFPHQAAAGREHVLRRLGGIRQR